VLFVVSAFATTRDSTGALGSHSSVASHVGVSAVNAVSVSHEPMYGPMQSLGTCASIAIVFSVVVALSLLWASRRTVPVSSGSMGAEVGATAGLAAVAAMQPSCGAHVTHALTAHGLPMVVATVLCTFLGRRALAP
jgi:hypothetical protein